MSNILNELMDYINRLEHLYNLEYPINLKDINMLKDCYNKINEVYKK